MFFTAVLFWGKKNKAWFYLGTFIVFSLEEQEECNTYLLNDHASNQPAEN